MTDRLTLAAILFDMGQAGKRVNEIDACEAGAGNISVMVAEPVPIGESFPDVREVDLPWTVPGLAGHTVFVTGTGRRLRQLCEQPEANIGAFDVHEGGRTATLHFNREFGEFRPTSEFNSHLGVHEDQVLRRQVGYHALVHAQPPNLTFMSHVPAYQDFTAYNHAILRWESEAIIQLPEGVKYMPFMVPGSQELMENNIAGLRDHQITIWAKHGLMARSDTSALAAVDKIEYAEMGAHYELTNLRSGNLSVGLTDDEIRRVIDAFDVRTTLY